MTAPVPLRPFLAADAPRLQDLFAQSVEHLAAEDYDEDQRLAWISRAADLPAFAERLAGGLTLVAERAGTLFGFASLSGGNQIDMLYVHPHAARRGVATTLVDALERLAAARGVVELRVEASDTAIAFFQQRGYAASERRSFPIGDVWVSNTVMKKHIGPPARATSGSAR